MPSMLAVIFEPLALHLKLAGNGPAGSRGPILLETMRMAHPSAAPGPASSAMGAGNRKMADLLRERIKAGETYTAASPVDSARCVYHLENQPLLAFNTWLAASTQLSKVHDGTAELFCYSCAAACLCHIERPTPVSEPGFPAENLGSKRSSVEQQAESSAATKRQRTDDGKAEAVHQGDQEGAAADVKPEDKQEAREANTVTPEGGAVREDESAKLDPAAFWSALEAKGEAKGEARADTEPNATDVSNSVSVHTILGLC